MGRPKTIRPDGPINKENKTMDVKVTKTVTALETFEDVTLQKTVIFTPPKSVDEILEILGNDSAKFLEVAIAGLRDHVVSAARANSDGWKQETEDGELVDFVGQIADPEKVNPIVKALAGAYGWKPGVSAEVRKAAKAKAIEFLKANPAYIELIK